MSFLRKKLDELLGADECMTTPRRTLVSSKSRPMGSDNNDSSGSSPEASGVLHNRHSMSSLLSLPYHSSEEEYRAESRRRAEERRKRAEKDYEADQARIKAREEALRCVQKENTDNLRILDERMEDDENDRKKMLETANERQLSLDDHIEANKQLWRFEMMNAEEQWEQDRKQFKTVIEEKWLESFIESEKNDMKFDKYRNRSDEFYKLFERMKRTDEEVKEKQRRKNEEIEEELLKLKMMYTKEQERKQIEKELEEKRLESKRVSGFMDGQEKQEENQNFEHGNGILVVQEETVAVQPLQNPYSLTNIILNAVKKASLLYVKIFYGADKQLPLRNSAEKDDVDTPPSLGSVPELERENDRSEVSRVVEKDHEVTHSHQVLAEAEQEVGDSEVSNGKECEEGEESTILGTLNSTEGQCDPDVIFAIENNRRIVEGYASMENDLFLLRLRGVKTSTSQKNEEFENDRTKNQQALAATQAETKRASQEGEASYQKLRNKNTEVEIECEQSEREHQEKQENDKQRNEKFAEEF